MGVCLVVFNLKLPSTFGGDARASEQTQDRMESEQRRDECQNISSREILTAR